MPDDSNARGFSFLISDTPPPVAGLEALELDFSDLAAGVAEPATDEPPQGECLPVPVEVHSPAAPAVRAVQFPTAKRRTTALSPRPSTRFSESVGRTRPRVESSTDEEPVELAPPRDLLVDDVPRLAADWAPDTPTAAELWSSAGSRLRTLAGTVRAAGERGLVGGRAAAEGLSEALRHRMHAAQEVGAVPGPEAGAAASVANPRRVPARSRALLAPGAAAVAAVTMYLLSSRFLGGTDTIALSKAAVPDLGQLEERHLALAEAPLRSAAKDRSSPGSRPEAAAPPPLATEVVPIPDGMSWPGKGLLEVVTADDELIYVDGVFTGRGPLRRIPVTSGEHEITIRKDGGERQGKAVVLLDRCTRALFTAR